MKFVNFCAGVGCFCLLFVVFAVIMFNGGCPSLPNRFEATVRSTQFLTNGNQVDIDYRYFYDGYAQMDRKEYMYNDHHFTNIAHYKRKSEYIIDNTLSQCAIQRVQFPYTTEWMCAFQKERSGFSMSGNTNIGVDVYSQQAGQVILEMLSGSHIPVTLQYVIAESGVTMRLTFFDVKEKHNIEEKIFFVPDYCPGVF